MPFFKTIKQRIWDEPLAEKKRLKAIEKEQRRKAQESFFKEREIQRIKLAKKKAQIMAQAKEKQIREMYMRKKTKPIGNTDIFGTLTRGLIGTPQKQQPQMQRIKVPIKPKKKSKQKYTYIEKPIKQRPITEIEDPFKGIF